MKYKVRIAEKNYEVEIEDIHARPVIARVDGQAFEVSPENGIKPTPQKQTSEIKSIAVPKSPVNAGANVNGSELTAPLPGTVTEIFVKAGEQIEAGQVVLTAPKESDVRYRRHTLARWRIYAGQVTT